MGVSIIKGFMGDNSAAWINSALFPRRLRQKRVTVNERR